MAQSTFGSLISIAAVGGLAWWAYEHFIAGPSVVAPPVGGGPPAPMGGGAGTTPVPNPNPTPSGPCSGQGVLVPLLAAVQAAQGATYGPNLPGTLTIDEWDFYGNRICTGIMDQFGVNADTLFPGRDDRGGPLNWNAFEGYAKQRGLSDLIPVDWPVPVFPGRGHKYGRFRRPQLIGTHLAWPWRVA